MSLLRLFHKRSLWRFPSLDVLRLAIASEAVPAAILATPLQATFEADGGVLVAASVDFDAALQTKLRRLGVATTIHAPPSLEGEYAHWLELLPLTADVLARQANGRASEREIVVFDVAAGEPLASLVNEVLRLGNDRQSVRWIEGERGSRALLRVIDPPYYSLLRALESGDVAAPTAYVERAPRVWVEWGYQYPLVKSITLPAGKCVFLRPPRSWTIIDEGKFEDIYAHLDVQLPATTAQFKAQTSAARFQVPLKLVPAHGSEPAEMWVLSAEGKAQLEALVESSDDALLARLSFAVVEAAGDERVILRVRPSKQPPPVLVLDGIALRNHLKIANLFVPTNARLHPPLRRETVLRLLASEPGVLVWLYPEGEGRFRPECISDRAFRPLTDWVEYVLDRDQVQLKAWMQSLRFDFEAYETVEVNPAGPKPKSERTEKPKRETIARDEPAPILPTDMDDAAAGAAAELALASIDDDTAEARPPDKLREELRQLEQQSQSLEAAWDDPVRWPIWQRMGELHARLGNPTDATICWLQSIWEREPLEPRLAAAWFADEAHARSPEQWTAVDIDRQMQDERLVVPTVRALAAYLVWAAQQPAPPAALAGRLQRVQQFIQQHEVFVSVRVVWLAWLAIVRLAHGDELALARVRDRILERLHRGGLSPDLDLPSFLRASEFREGDHVQNVRTELESLRQLAIAWIGRAKTTILNPQLPPYTSRYADLIFAYAFARVGDAGQAKTLLQSARGELEVTDELNSWLVQAFALRVRAALDSRPIEDGLPANLNEELQKMQVFSRFKVTKFRERSRILEPHVRVDSTDSYFITAGMKQDEFAREMTAVADIADPVDVRARLARWLTQETQQTPEQRLRLFCVALELAPRLGEDFAQGVLQRVGLVIEQQPQLASQFLLLEKAIVAAANFDLKTNVSAFVDRFRQLLFAHPLQTAIPALESFLQHAFRGLRKLGMRDVTSSLLSEIADLVRQAENDLPAMQPAAATIRASAAGEDPVQAAKCRLLRLLLNVAAGWLYFGQKNQARPALDDARQMLFRGGLVGTEQRALAKAYVSALAQAPTELAITALEELFQHLEGIEDNFTTMTHFSLSHLEIIEAVVLSLLGDDVSLDKSARRWLDDDEYLVRRRIHRDLRSLVQAGS